MKHALKSVRDRSLLSLEMVETGLRELQWPMRARLTMPTLLIVEDEGSFRQFISLALQMEGYQVHSVENGERAIQALQTAAPDLVILDLSMPDISGWDVLRFIRRTPHLVTMPVLVLTANADIDTRRLCQHEHVSQLLLKPASLDEILDAVRDALAVS